MGRHESVKKKKTSALKIIGIILLILLVLIVILAGIGIGYVYTKLGQINVEEIDETAIGIEEETQERLAKYRNIAIFGIDSRADGDYGIGNRSDCIIIASLNQETKDIKLLSVYRDTYLQMESNKKQILDKAAHAYAYGGAQNAVKMLNTNLDLNITEYVTVNFDAVVDAVDAMGGITLDIDSSELKYINDYISATSSITGVKSKSITKTGKQTVDGVQAVAYSRIRYTAGGDFKRTERMRTVIEAMLAKAKTLSISQLNGLVNTMLPEDKQKQKISTNIKPTEILALVPSIASFNIDENIGWPYETRGTTTGTYYGVPVTLESNVEKLHKEVFEQSDYVVSETVKNISDKIVKKTGYK